MEQMRIGFIDYSPEERNRILATLDLLSKHGALDELGIGSVRDAYSDRLFPGISTLQRRAKYFVLIPYVFQVVEKQVIKGKCNSAEEFRRSIYQEQDKLAGILTTKYPDDVGIIGSEAFRNKRSVKIKPTSIYWNGLGQFGILRNRGLSFEATCKQAFVIAKKKAEMELLPVENNESFDDPTAMNQGNTLFLPILHDEGFPKSATISLTNKEAEFIYDCVLSSPFTSHSLLAHMLRNRIVYKSFEDIPEESLPPDLCQAYHFAREFARFIRGAHIRYNVIFSEYTDDRQMQNFEAWRTEFLSRPIDIKPILDYVVCRKDLSDFCILYKDAILRNDSVSLDNLIVNREKRVKTDRAKLKKPKEYQYSSAHPIHDYYLNYRYERAHMIVNDILQGLEAKQDV